MKFLKSALCLCLTAALLTAGTSFAADKEAKAAAKANRKRFTAQQFLPKGMELNEEQNKKVEEIEKELGPKLESAAKAARDVLTKEQHQAGRDAAKAAKDAGLKKQEAKAAVEKAVAMTDEQKKKQEEADKALAAVRFEITERIKALLTNEQLAKLNEAKGKGKTKTDAAKTDSAKTAPAKTEPAKTEPAKPEAPKTEAPKTEAPKSEAK